MYSKVLFFDSDCIMCNSFIQWVHHHDPKDQIRFSHFHTSLAEKLQLSIDDHTMIYYADGTKYNRSQAFIEIMKELQVPSFFIWILRSIPRPIRDTIYRFIAHNRYRLGKKDPSQSCSLEIQAKIIE